MEVFLAHSIEEKKETENFLVDFRDLGYSPN